MSSLFESLENRTLMSTAVPFPVGDVYGPNTTLDSVDAGGRHLAQLSVTGMDIAQIAQLGDTIYFRGSTGLWRTDGSAAGTKQVISGGGDQNLVGQLVRQGNKLFFSLESYSDTQHETYGYLKWIDSTGTMGTVSGVGYGDIGVYLAGGELYGTSHHYAPNYLLKAYHIVEATATEVDYTSRPAGDPVVSLPSSSLMVGSTRIYANDDGVHGNELWVDPGSGGHLAQDLFPGAASSTPKNFLYLNGHVIFQASMPRVWAQETATLSNGALLITGSDAADHVVISSTGGVTTVTLDVDSLDHHYQSTFNDSDIKGIIVRCNAGDDLIDLTGTNIPATLQGEAGNDTILTGQGNDNNDGGVGTNVINPPTVLHVAGGLLNIAGTAGNDRIVLQRNTSDGSLLDVDINGQISTYQTSEITFVQIDGKAGNDLIQFDQTNGPLAFRTKLFGGAGNDTIYGSAGADQIHGGDGDDYLSAGAGNDAVYGDVGNDKLYGGDGNDYLDGGAGVDMIRGDNGMDRIIATIGLDDYSKNKGDILTLSH